MMGDVYQSRGTLFGNDHSAENHPGGPKMARNVAKDSPGGRFWGTVIGMTGNSIPGMTVR